MCYDLKLLSLYSEVVEEDFLVNWDYGRKVLEGSLYSAVLEVTKDSSNTGLLMLVY